MLHSFFKKWLLFTLIIASACIGVSQEITSQIRFDYLSIKDGLSQSLINTIVQDKQGFIWLGTQDGLNKYDGYEFTTFYHDPKDTNSIPDNFIHTIINDSKGNLWLGTEEGLSRYNPKTKQFTNFYHQQKNKNSLRSNIVFALIEDENGTIWVGTEEGLDALTTPNETRQNAIFKHLNIAVSEVSSLLIDKQKKLWVGTNNGLYYKKTKTEFQHFKVNNSRNSINDNQIWALKQTKNGIIWVGTNNGFCSIKKSFTNFKITNFLNNGLNSAVVKTIFLDENSNLWIGTEGGGLNHIKIANNKIIEINTYKSKVLEKGSICSDFIYCILQDAGGVYWLGTNNGVNKFDPKKQSFYHFTLSNGTANGITDNNIWTILEDHKNRVWIGTRSGLGLYDTKTKKVKLFSNISKTKTFLSNKIVLSCFQTKAGDIFIGTGDGVYKVDYNEEKNKAKFTRINYANKYFSGAIENRIYSLAEDHEGNLWVGTKMGLAKVNLKKNTHYFYSSNKDIKGSLSNNTVRVIKEDSQNNLWVGTADGFNKVLYQNKDSILFKNYYHDFDNDRSISNNMVISILENQANSLWLGTYGGGLNLFDIKNEKFIAYTEKEGLANNVVYGILKDEKENLWMSTNRGLSKYNSRQNKFTTYKENDGLQSNEFNIGAYYQNSNKKLFFGGINGFNFFNPEKVTINTTPPLVVITDFKVLNRSRKSNQFFTDFNISSGKIIQLEPTQNHFAFEFRGLHYSYSEKNQYAYKLVGLDEDWNYCGTQKIAQFNNISPGKYTFLVKSANSDGLWSNQVDSLNLIISPPIWQRWWFILLTIIFVFGTLFGMYKTRINMVRSQKRELERIVKERTQQVTEQKEELERKKDLLQLEKNKTDELLLNILPQQTVDELKTKGKATARHYRRATVMFSDIKGFTKISERLRPQQIVEKLDAFFVKFDEIIEQHDVEKIKTIGDAYMCAGGIPIRNRTNPIDVVLAGWKMQQHVLSEKARLISEGREDEVWEMRIGIHTGELTAGVIGIKRFAYDIWGDTVNVANRMESSCEVGKVNVSGKTYEAVKSFFQCTYRGKIMAKNKGEVDMYFIDGIKKGMSIDGLGLEPNSMFYEYVTLKIYSSLNYRKAEHFIIKTLENGLSPDLTYHNLRHTKDVCSAVERIAQSEGVSGEDLFLLKTAALYHDAGFVKQYADNEPVGVAMAKEALPKYGYNEEQLDLIEELILATIVPQQPKTHLQEIICDADLDYLGRDDFDEISDELRKEFLANGVVKNNKHWDEIQIGFLGVHKFFTKTSRKLREQKKAQHVEKIKKRYAEDLYEL